MKEISTIQEAEEYIYTFDPYTLKGKDQEALFRDLKSCEQLALQYHNSKLLCNTRIFLCNYYIHINDLENALNTGLDNRRLAETERLEEALLSMYAVLFEIYLSLGDFANMEEVLYLYREKLQDSRNFTKLSTIEILTAVQANNLKDHERCLSSNRRAIDYALQSGNNNLILYAYNNLGYQYLDQDTAIAGEALENALAIIHQHPQQIPIFTVAIVKLNASRLYIRTGDLDKSYDLIRSCIRILKKIKNVNELNSAYVILSEIYIRRKRFKTALDLLKLTEKNCEESNNNFVRLSCYQAFVQLYEQRKKYKEALEYHRKFHRLNEDIFNEESAKKIRNLQILNEVNAIKKQRDHAEAMANLKHDFLANMSHEIRTPINSVLGLCYLLQREDLDAKQQQYVERLQYSGENLLGLINDILDISKIEAGKMEMAPEALNLAAFLDRITRPFASRAEQKILQFSAKIPDVFNTPVYADPVRLSQVFNNLLANALKFTEQGSIRLEGQVYQADEHTLYCRFIIRDTGIGIPADKQEQVFGRYEQASASTKKNYGGTGLGLSITKKLLDLMQGHIRLESELGKGSAFILDIPLPRSAAAPVISRTDLTDTAFLDGKRILLADDHEENRLVTRELLLNFAPDIQIEEAADGLEVMALVHNMDFDLIIMDLDMPGLNGLEATQQIRRQYPGAHTGIIAHTASLLSLSKEELQEVGFDELLLKPFKPEDLLRVLRSASHKKAG